MVSSASDWRWRFLQAGLAGSTSPAPPLIFVHALQSSLRTPRVDQEESEGARGPSRPDSRRFALREKCQLPDEPTQKILVQRGLALPLIVRQRK